PLGPFATMASSSLLDGLKFSRFLADEDAVGQGSFTTEGRDGVALLSGLFRVQTLERKEAAMSETEMKKLGPLSPRLIECFSGQTLKVAQTLDIKRLEESDGLTYLMDAVATELRRRRLQQARDLYEAGAATGEIMARQPAETMSQLLLRRRAWYRAMTDLNAQLKLPDVILAEPLLNNAGLTSNQNLMIRTTLHGDMTFDKVAEELISQHPRIHERAQGHPGLYTDGILENFEDIPEPIEAEALPMDEDEPQHDNEYPDEDDDGFYEIGTFAEEHLACLAEGGLDLDDMEGCEYASELIQAHEEAYFAGTRAATASGSRSLSCRAHSASSAEGSCNVQAMRSCWTLQWRCYVPTPKSRRERARRAMERWQVLLRAPRSLRLPLERGDPKARNPAWSTFPI
ncbi:TY4B-J, partial [Symbiodinium sp. CCMP2456]